MLHRTAGRGGRGLRSATTLDPMLPLTDQAADMQGLANHREIPSQGLRDESHRAPNCCHSWHLWFDLVERSKLGLGK